MMQTKQKLIPILWFCMPAAGLLASSSSLSEANPSNQWNFGNQTVRCQRKSGSYNASLKVLIINKSRYYKEKKLRPVWETCRSACYERRLADCMTAALASESDKAAATLPVYCLAPSVRRAACTHTMTYTHCTSQCCQQTYHTVQLSLNNDWSHAIRNLAQTHQMISRVVPMSPVPMTLIKVIYIFTIVHYKFITTSFVCKKTILWKNQQPTLRVPLCLCSYDITALYKSIIIIIIIR